MKKEIIIGQNQSNSLSTLIRYFSGEHYSVRIAANFEAMVKLEQEKPSDILIFSAELLPKELTPSLSALRKLCPKSKIIVTHSDSLLIKKQLGGLLPTVHLFDSHAENELPADMISLIEEKKSRPGLRTLLSTYLPQLEELGDLAPSWFLF